MSVTGEQKVMSAFFVKKNIDIPPPPPPPPSPEDPAVKAEVLAAQQRAQQTERGIRGRSATVLTGGEGVSEEEETTVSSRVLLGA